MRPRLIHPEDVTVRQTVASVPDATFGEPVGTPTTTDLVLRGQVKLVQERPLALNPGGATATADALGHVVFDAAALAAAGITLRPGDRIVKRAGEQPVNWRVLRLEGHAVYQGEPRHLWAFFGPESQ